MSASGHQSVTSGQQESVPPGGDSENDSSTPTVDVNSLCVADSIKKPDNKLPFNYSPVSGTLEERSEHGLNHIAQVCIRNIGSFEK